MCPCTVYIFGNEFTGIMIDRAFSHHCTDCSFQYAFSPPCLMPDTAKKKWTEGKAVKVYDLTWEIQILLSYCYHKQFQEKGTPVSCVPIRYYFHAFSLSAASKTLRFFSVTAFAECLKKRISPCTFGIFYKNPSLTGFALYKWITKNPAESELSSGFSVIYSCLFAKRNLKNTPHFWGHGIRWMPDKT